MATLKQRLHRKNSSGTYDTIHLETSADCITGTLSIAHGGTGATTAANARTNLGAAASSHNHSAANITSGTLSVARGGTGVTSNPSMLVNLASTTAASVFAASPRPGVTGTLPVNRGGTGRATLTSGYFLRGNGTGAITMSSIDQVKEALGITASNPVIVKTGTIDRLQYDYYYGSIESVTLTACDYIVITNTYNTSYPQVTIAKGGSGIVAVYFTYQEEQGEMTTTANLNSAGTTLSFDSIGSASGKNSVTLHVTYVTYKYK